jgi:hypothetical protein
VEGRPQDESADRGDADKPANSLLPSSFRESDRAVSSAVGGLLLPAGASADTTVSALSALTVVSLSERSFLSSSILLRWLVACARGSLRKRLKAQIAAGRGRRGSNRGFGSPNKGNMQNSA